MPNISPKPLVSILTETLARARSLTNDAPASGPLLRGQPQTLKAGDMFIAEEAGILSSIVYGPDQRTAIGPETRHAVFTVYAPPGIAAPAVLQHVEDIRQNVETLAPAAQVELLKVFGAAD